LLSLHGSIVAMNSCSVVQLDECPPSAGAVVVVVDVIRAFTSAATAFAAGADRIFCVERLDQAFALRGRHRGALLMGEQHGARPDGFDLGNSPVEVGAADLTGKWVIQRTSNGTRGLVAGCQPESILAAAAINVDATARWITVHRPGAAVTIVCTGETSEDKACASHLGAILRGETPSRAGLSAAVRSAACEHVAQWRNPHHAKHEGFTEDVEACSDVDRYDFAMVEPDMATRSSYGPSHSVRRAAEAKPSQV
jgi:2-phosphosulfolactate phosphatase